MPSRRLLAATAFLACLAAAPALGGGAAARGATQAPRAELRDPVCRNSAAAPRRVVSVTALMRPMGAPERLSLRPELLRRTTGPFRVVRGGFLGRWITPRDRTLGSRPGDVWLLRLPVSDLGAPAEYRIEVTFRWRSERGRILATRSAAGPVCRQTSPR